MQLLRPRQVAFFGWLFIFQFTQLEKIALKLGQPRKPVGRASRSAVEGRKVKLG